MGNVKEIFRRKKPSDRASQPFDWMRAARLLASHITDDSVLKSASQFQIGDEGRCLNWGLDSRELPSKESSRRFSKWYAAVFLFMLHEVLHFSGVEGVPVAPAPTLKPTRQWCLRWWSNQLEHALTFLCFAKPNQAGQVSDLAVFWSLASSSSSSVVRQQFE